ncbi:palmdelphin [Syngnathoides biaculeatus]|uniref:palmdelphin n=1 Tax=Syngnathoides biaculeatus TaxID=300417 RepID=UPI002ADD8013|nr:palmdelphin [Syngnathoides biaculeatus]XP_061661586.1 palmdelphin [Syngnathoides biaculeatus]
MEERNLLKERLQAITDKRRIQEYIAKKRREIEEEKLKLQYIKKKALREQWLMDGLSQQSEEEQEAMRLQAQDEQQQSDQLQSNIDRIEKEIKALETEELNISANEEYVLKRLKEVERTPEDIIKRAASETEESDGQELNKGSGSSQNHDPDDIAMETTERAELEMDSSGEVDVAELAEKEINFNVESQQISIHEDPSDFSDGSSSGNFSTDVVTDAVNVLPACPETGVCNELPILEEKETVAIEEEHDELKRNESITSSVSDTLSSAESVYENEAHCKTQVEIEPERGSEQHCELQKDLNPVKLVETQETSDVEPDTCPEQSTDLQLFLGEDEEPNFCNDDYHNSELDDEEDPEVPGNICEEHSPEELMLEQNVREDAMSDISSESCRYFDPDEVDECLRVEVAAASSDSETDEKWRTIFSSSINKEDDDSYLDSLQLSAQELFVQKVEVIDSEEPESDPYNEVQLNVPEIEELLEQSDTVSCSPPPQDGKCIPLSLQGLSKISEDESENGKDDSNNSSTQEQSSQNKMSDPNRKLPKDFCVIQETTSENVSTEHVDFQLARKQWRAMEEQTKNKVLVPATRLPNFHCSHNCMYTPVRNIERTNRKSQDLENLTLVGDYTNTQFSPCSEDSGLDDSSYRSPNDDFETPVEREIRISMEREERFRKERSLSCMGKSADAPFSTPAQGIPRSISTPLTPSFIITSFPAKEPSKNETSPTNVSILDPSSDFNSNPRHGEWRSEDVGSNLIILETSNLIIRSASEFSLNKACEPQEKMFLSNPFFKLRSRSTMSLVDEEIQMVKQREEELRQERALLYGKGRFGDKRMLSNNLGTLSLDNSACLPVKCKSSPSSPMKTPKMDRSTLSCDHRFPDVYTAGRRKSAMALRWEAGEFTKND